MKQNSILGWVLIAFMASLTLWFAVDSYNLYKSGEPRVTKQTGTVINCDCWWDDTKAKELSELYEEYGIYPKSELPSEKNVPRPWALDEGQNHQTQP